MAFDSRESATKRRGYCCGVLVVLGLVIGLLAESSPAAAQAQKENQAKRPSFLLRDRATLLALFFNPYTLKTEGDLGTVTAIRRVEKIPQAAPAPAAGANPARRDNATGVLYYKGVPQPRQPRRPSFRSPIRPGW